MNETCDDNREILIAKYFELLKKGTNIETSLYEMNVVRNILFREWQLGWLDRLENAVSVVRCKDCKHFAEELCWNLYGRCVTVSGLDYCSNGERRDNDDTNIDERKEDSEE